MRTFHRKYRGAILSFIPSIPRQGLRTRKYSSAHSHSKHLKADHHRPARHCILAGPWSNRTASVHPGIWLKLVKRTLIKRWRLSCSLWPTESMLLDKTSTHTRWSEYWLATWQSTRPVSLIRCTGWSESAALLVLLQCSHLIKLNFKAEICFPKTTVCPNSNEYTQPVVLCCLVFPFCQSESPDQFELAEAVSIGLLMYCPGKQSPCWGRESWWFFFHCVVASCVSSSWCRESVCSLWVWRFLIKTIETFVVYFDCQSLDFCSIMAGEWTLWSAHGMRVVLQLAAYMRWFAIYLSVCLSTLLSKISWFI